MKIICLGCGEWHAWRGIVLERVNRLAINPTLLDDNILDLFFAPRA